MGRCQEGHLGGGKRLDAKLEEIKRDIRNLSKTGADCNAFPACSSQTILCVALLAAIVTNFILKAVYE